MAANRSRKMFYAKAVLGQVLAVAGAFLTGQQGLMAVAGGVMVGIGGMVTFLCLNESGAFAGRFAARE